MRLSPLAALALALLPAAAPAADPPRNVVLFVTDDQGLHAGCYGTPGLQTPHLDRLAADGARFDFAFCTTASCSASRSVLLTGRHNHATGQFGHQHAVHHFSVFDDVKSLPAYLKAAGYRTARAGKFHVAPDANFPFDQALGGAGRGPVALAEACGAFVAADKEKPFFLYICPTEPHRAAGRRDDRPGNPNRFGNPLPGGRPAPGVEEVVYDPNDVHVPPWLPDTPASRAELAEYYQAVSRADQGLGRLVQLLKDAGQYDHTLIICASDNGAPFPGAKTTLYDPGMRLPCVVRHPHAAKRGTVSQALVSWVDIAPTILDFAGAAVTPGQFHGRSFLPAAAGEELKDRDEVYASHTFHEVTMYYPMRVVRTRTHKLIFNIAHGLPFPFASDLWVASAWQEALKQGPDARYGQRTVRTYQHRPRFELYDLASDPGETRNLADDPRHAGRLQELQEKLRAFQKQTADPWLVKWEHE
jgi:N-sulfoglucosamine sulfohydrolase